MNGHDAGPFCRQPGMAALPPVRGTVVHDPEHSGSGAVRFLSHDLRDQTLERDDAGCGLATSKNMGSTDIPSRQIGYRTAAFVFVLDPHRPARRWRQTSVLTLKWV